MVSKILIKNVLCVEKCFVKKQGSNMEGRVFCTVQILIEIIIYYSTNVLPKKENY